MRRASGVDAIAVGAAHTKAMKIIGGVIILLLLMILVKIPSGLQIGEGIIKAQETHVEELRLAEEQRLKRAAEEEGKREKAAVEANRNAAQRGFDALPKWDPSGNPINREPPPGLSPTESVPPSPSPVATPVPRVATPPPRTPTPAERAAEIERRFGPR